MASKAYQDHGAIIIWWDEAESDGVAGDNPDDLTHTIGEIVISPDAHPNVGGISLCQRRVPHSLVRSAHHAGNLPRDQPVLPGRCNTR